MHNVYIYDAFVHVCYIILEGCLAELSRVLDLRQSGHNRAQIHKTKICAMFHFQAKFGE